MTARNRVLISRLSFGVLIGVILLAGWLVGACASPGSQVTPTPTKTPRPATAAPTVPSTAVATLPPAAAPTAVLPSPTAAPTQAAVATKPAATQAAATAVPPSATAKPANPTLAPQPALSGSMSSPDFGVQAFLWWRPEVADRDLDLIRDAGFGWVKQYFAWQDIEGAAKGKFDWSRSDRVVDQVQQRGLKLIVRIGQDPDRPFWAGDAPANAGHFADFARQVAARYRGRIQAYQVWNEPNLAREWGKKRPDPVGYAGMLKQVYAAIKASDPAAAVVTAGMAPTTQDNNEAMPDLVFYQGLYDAMGKQSNGYFDFLGAHGAGWAVSPETDPQVVATDPKLHNNDPSAAALKRVYAFRRLEDIRALMVNNGDANKRIVVLEFGWTTDPRQNTGYYWHGAGAGIDESVKGKYLVRAYQYAAKNWQPWIALMVAIYMPDVNWKESDEQYWWSIMTPAYPGLYFRAAYVELCIYINGLKGQRCKYDPNK